MHEIFILERLISLTLLDVKLGGWVAHILGQARHFVCPDALVAQGMLRVTLEEKVLEESHVLEAEQGDLVLRLERVSSWQCS